MPSTLRVTRRRALAAVGGAVGLLGVGGAGGYALRDELEPDAAPAAVAPTDWPHPSRGPGNARRAPAANAPDGGLELAWTLDLRELRDPERASPVVANGTVSLAGAFRGESQSIRAFDLTTGRERWRLRTEAEYAAAGTVVAVGDRLLWHRDTRTSGDVLEARAATDGRLLWRRASKTGFRPRSGPLVRGGRVHLQLSGEQSHAAAVVALGDGATRWRSGLGGRSFVPPAVGDGVAVYGSEDGLVALDAATGDRRWTAGFEASDRRDQAPYPYGRLVVADGRVFAASYHGELAAFDTEDGSALWRRRLEQFGRSGHWYGLGAAGDGTVFSVAENHRAERKTLHARDAETGEVLWTLPASADDAGNVSVPTLCDGLVYAVRSTRRDGSNAAELVRCDAETGAVESATELGAYSSAPPVVAAGTVLVPTTRGLEAFR